MAEAGLAQIRRITPQGMVTLRGDLGDPGVGAALVSATGAAMPARRALAAGRDGIAAAWMAPDEALLLVAQDRAAAIAAQLEAEAGASFATAVNVSDARALFEIEGREAAAVLAKLCPVDTARLPAGELRRTRCAQVAAAIWRTGPQTFRLICFRSVAAYVEGLLITAARSGGEVGRF